MENSRIPETVHESWHPHVQHLFNDDRMTRLKRYILPKEPFYPTVSQIFRVFSMPIQEIKVVVLSQDPYYNGQGIGLAFAVNHSVEMPPSLKVIRQEVEREEDSALLETSREAYPDTPQWKELKHWREQGVFLLNTALTVSKGRPNSHSEYWSWFTKEIVSIISKVAMPIWLLWGREAQKFESYILGRLYYKDFVAYSADAVTGQLSSGHVIDVNWVIKAAHPAAGLREGVALFIGCNNFHYCNQILKAKGYEPIKW